MYFVGQHNPPSIRVLVGILKSFVIELLIFENIPQPRQTVEFSLRCKDGLGKHFQPNVSTSIRDSQLVQITVREVAKRVLLTRVIYPKLFSELILEVTLIFVVGP